MEKRSLRDSTLASYRFLRTRSREGGADLFFLVSSDRMCVNGSKLQLRRFRLDLRKHAFNKRVVRNKERWSSPKPVSV